MATTVYLASPSQGGNRPFFAIDPSRSSRDPTRWKEIDYSNGRSFFFFFCKEKLINYRRV